MPATNPGARGRYVAVALRQLREESGLPIKEVARRVGWWGAKLSRVENFAVGISLDDVARLLDVYQPSTARRHQVLALVREYSGFSPRSAAMGGPALVDEGEPDTVMEWAAVTVPGILRTKDYASAVLRGGQAIAPVSPTAFDREVEEGRLWQRRLMDEDQPLALRLVLDESVLYRRFGGTAVMRAQLERLAKASVQPNVQLRVLRLGGGHPTGVGSFLHAQFLELHGVALPDVVLYEHLGRRCRTEGDEETYRHQLVFGQLWSSAARADDTAEIIRLALVKERKRSPES